MMDINGYENLKKQNNNNNLYINIHTHLRIEYDLGGTLLLLLFLNFLKLVKRHKSFLKFLFE